MTTFSPDPHLQNPSGDLFLSPRVIDRAAFEDFAARLRALIDDAAARGSAVRLASADAEKLHALLTEASRKNAEQVELSARVLKTLAQRTSEVDALLARAADLASAGAQMESRLAAIVDRRVAELDARAADLGRQLAAAHEEHASRLSAAVEAAEARVASAMERLDRARATLVQQTETTVFAAEKLLRAQCERAEKLLSAPAGLTNNLERIETAARRAETAAQQLAGIHARAESAATQLARSLDGSIAFSDELIAQRQSLDAQTARALEKVHEARKLLEPAQAIEARAGATADKLAEAAARAADAQAKARSIAAEVQRTVGLAADALEMLEPWRAVLLEPSPDGPLPEPIINLIARMRGELAHDLASVATAMQAIAAKAGGPPATQPPKLRAEPIVRVKTTRPRPERDSSAA
ncbi:MAG: hypothetical protein SFZ24_03540 [Planctomycetota bacterium]|nr:hypothetical protein [Planctomycetota bacterium]